MSEENKADAEGKKKQLLLDFYSRNPVIARLAAMKPIPELWSAASFLSNLKLPEVEVVDPAIFVNRDQSTAIRILQEKIVDYEKTIVEQRATIEGLQQMIKQLLEKKNMDQYQ